LLARSNHLVLPDHDLTLIVGRWPALAKATRQAILAMD
jgi:hypothetical protein